MGNYSTLVAGRNPETFWSFNEEDNIYGRPVGEWPLQRDCMGSCYKLDLQVNTHIGSFPNIPALTVNPYSPLHGQEGSCHYYRFTNNAWLGFLTRKATHHIEDLYHGIGMGPGESPLGPHEPPEGWGGNHAHPLIDADYFAIAVWVRWMPSLWIPDPYFPEDELEFETFTLVAVTFDLTALSTTGGSEFYLQLAKVGDGVAEPRIIGQSSLSANTVTAGAGGTVEHPGVIAADTWNHLGFVRDGPNNVLRFYVNGFMTNEITDIGDSSHPGEDAIIASPSSTWFNVGGYYRQVHVRAGTAWGMAEMFAGDIGPLAIWREPINDEASFFTEMASRGCFSALCTKCGMATPPLRQTQRDDIRHVGCANASSKQNSIRKGCNNVYL